MRTAKLSSFYALAVLSGVPIAGYAQQVSNDQQNSQAPSSVSSPAQQPPATQQPTSSSNSASAGVVDPATASKIGQVVGFVVGTPVTVGSCNPYLGGAVGMGANFSTQYLLTHPAPPPSDASYGCAKAGTCAGGNASDGNGTAADANAASSQQPGGPSAAQSTPTCQPTDPSGNNDPSAQPSQQPSPQQQQDGSQVTQQLTSANPSAAPQVGLTQSVSDLEGQLGIQSSVSSTPTQSASGQPVPQVPLPPSNVSGAANPNVNGVTNRSSTPSDTLNILNSLAQGLQSQTALSVTARRGMAVSGCNTLPAAAAWQRCSSAINASSMCEAYRAAAACYSQAAASCGGCSECIQQLQAARSQTLASAPSVCASH